MVTCESKGCGKQAQITIEFPNGNTWKNCKECAKHNTAYLIDHLESFSIRELIE